MIKKTVSLIIVTLILVSCIGTTVCAASVDASYNPTLIPLRAGGGGSGGGGGGSTHHSGTGRQPTAFESILNLIMMPFILFSSSIVFYIKLTKRSRKSKNLMKKMLQSDSAWKYKDISSTVKDSFMAIQSAWSDMDMTPAVKYMSDELFESFQTKLSWMSYRKEKNVLENIQLVKALPVAVYDDSDNSRDYIWFYIKGRMIDYTIDTDTQMKISGDTSPSTFEEYWQFTRKENCWVLNKILQKDESDQIPFSE